MSEQGRRFIQRVNPTEQVFLAIGRSEFEVVLCHNHSCEEGRKEGRRNKADVSQINTREKKKLTLILLSKQRREEIASSRKKISLV